MTDENDPYGKLKVFPKILVITVNLNQVYGVLIASNSAYLAVGDSHQDAHPTFVPIRAISQIITDPKILDQVAPNGGPHGAVTAN